MTRRVRIMLARTLLLTSGVLPGCGTVRTRFLQGNAIGHPPLMATVQDVVFVGHGPFGNVLMHYPAAPLFFSALLSLPVDLAVDVVLLPADLVGWAVGLDKWPHRSLDDERSEPPDGDEEQPGARRRGGRRR